MPAGESESRFESDDATHPLRVVAALADHALGRNVSASLDRPLVTIEAIRGVRHLVAVGKAGEAQGPHPGQTLTAARAGLSRAGSRGC